jgi:diguanylate cyclase (GGDEF)-like protein
MYAHTTVRVWNTIMMLGMFLFAAYSISTVKKLFIKEHEHADTDELTGVASIKFFYEQARIEISRAANNKLPLTLAYINIDNLRSINETLGHIAGDYLLHEVARVMRSTLRSTDIISRLGGAKFDVLMPETTNENATVIIYKLQEHLLEVVKKNHWPVTFRTGVVTCDATTCTIDELIAKAEGLMTTARKPTKMR